MTWTVLAEGTPDEFEAATPPVDYLSKGTKMKLEMTTTMPIAPLFDLWGTEWVVSKMINEGGANIVDVEGIGWNKVVVHMVADPVWVYVVIGVIIAICIYFGIQLFREMRLLFESVSPVVWGIIGIIAASIAIPLIMSLFRKEKKKE